MSAALVVIVASGVLAAFDASSRASANSRARSVAGALAQQDEDRLRSLSPAALTALASATPTAQPSSVAGYDVTSAAAWVDDPPTTATCGGSPAATRYLRTTSTVTGPRTPVTQTSLIAVPPNGGTLNIAVVNAGQQPVSGVTVTANGGGSTLTGTTTAGGCVEWSHLTPGTYAVTASKSGYVDPLGNTVVSKSVTVTSGTTSGQQITYDQAFAVTATFWTQIGTRFYTASGTHSPNYTPAAAQRSDRITVSHPSMSGPRTFGTAGTLSTTLATSGDGPAATPSPGLFPFSTAYSVYAGDCDKEDPTTYGLARQPLSNDPAYPGKVTPFAGVSGAPTGVRMPPMDLTVSLRTSGTSPFNASLVIKRAAAGTCPAVTYPTITLGADPGDSTKTAGRLPFPGLPFGTYSLCASTTVSGVVHYHALSSVTLNTWTGASAGAPAITIDGRSGKDTTPC